MTSHRLLAKVWATLAFSAIAFAAQAQVTVSNAWVRATVPGQEATGMFGTLTAPQDSKLVGASSPVAASVEVHEMKMDGDVMRMRAVPSLPLPAGQAVALKPGSYHVMLLGLKKPLAEGSTVPVKLVVEDAQKKQSTVEVKVQVKRTAPAMGGDHGRPGHHDHGSHDHGSHGSHGY